MPYQAELRFVQDYFTRCSLQFLLLTPFTPPDPRVDLGLRHMLGRPESYDEMYRTFRSAREGTLYRATDPYLCSYRFFRLPAPRQDTVVQMGPYLSARPTRDQLLEQAALQGVSPERMGQLEKYYDTVPILPQGSPLFSALDVLVTRVFGGEDELHVLDVNYELADAPSPLSPADRLPSPAETDWIIQTTQARYTYENELMTAVSQGLTHKVELLLDGLSQHPLPRRSDDELRDSKNFCIITNTLLRKAAEQGGVHPVYLDSMSSDFALRIEQIHSPDRAKDLISEMFRAYCRLVRRHATRRYSPPVENAVIHIDADLAGDLSLKSLAALQNINASYLSALFKRETGQTVTDYVCSRRMRHATKLLSTTHLQIQTVALHCGIPDVNYFSKLFKKHFGLSPSQFRAVQNRGAK